MKAFGFFEDLPHGLKGSGKLVAHRRDVVPCEARPCVASYLRNAYTVAATSAMADDGLNPERTRISPINLKTDGEFVWPEDLAYYVETYGLELPLDLLERTRSCTPPDLTPDRVAAVRAWVMSGMHDDDVAGEAADWSVR